MRLPFETGLLSTMSEPEMHDLATELDRVDFWRQEERIKDLVDTYIKHYWRNPDPSAYYHGPQFVTSALSEARSGTPSVSMRYRDMRVRVPHGIDERAARLFAEIQMREQMDPGFDPTEDEE